MPRLRRIGRAADAPERSEGVSVTRRCGCLLFLFPLLRWRLMRRWRRWVSRWRRSRPRMAPVVDARRAAFPVWKPAGEAAKGVRSGRVASDASRVTKTAPIRGAVFVALRCSLPGQPRTPKVPSRQDRMPRGMRGKPHGRVGASAGGCPGPLGRCRPGCCNMLRHARTYCSTEGRPRGGRPRPTRARSWACTRPPTRRREGRRGRGPGST